MNAALNLRVSYAMELVSHISKIGEFFLQTFIGYYFVLKIFHLYKSLSNCLAYPMPNPIISPVVSRVYLEIKNVKKNFNMSYLQDMICIGHSKLMFHFERKEGERGKRKREKIEA